jgi:hypothetical protein
MYVYLQSNEKRGEPWDTFIVYWLHIGKWECLFDWESFFLEIFGSKKWVREAQNCLCLLWNDKPRGNKEDFQSPNHFVCDVSTQEAGCERSCLLSIDKARSKDKIYCLCIKDYLVGFNGFFFPFLPFFFFLNWRGGRLKGWLLRGRRGHIVGIRRWRGCKRWRCRRTHTRACKRRIHSMQKATAEESRVRANSTPCAPISPQACADSAELDWVMVVLLASA